MQLVREHIDDAGARVHVCREGVGLNTAWIIADSVVTVLHEVVAMG